MCVFAIYGTNTFAANPACGPSFTVPTAPIPSSASCDTTITTDLIGQLSFTSAASVSTQPNVTVNVGGSTANYGFGSTILDLRNTQDGWQLQASSAGLLNGSSVVPLRITGATSTCTASSGGNTCVSTTATPITLTTTPTTFLATGNPTHPISGTFNISTTGSYTFPSDAPTGTYSGIITISLVNTF